MHPHFHLVSERGLSDLIPTNLEREDPVMDADHHSLPDVAIQPNKPPGFDGYNYPFWKFRMDSCTPRNQEVCLEGSRRQEGYSNQHPSLDLFFPDSLESSQENLALIPNESEDAQ